MDCDETPLLFRRLGIIKGLRQVFHTSDLVQVDDLIPLRWRGQQALAGATHRDHVWRHDKQLRVEVAPLQLVYEEPDMAAARINERRAVFRPFALFAVSCGPAVSARLQRVITSKYVLLWIFAQITSRESGVERRMWARLYHNG